MTDDGVPPVVRWHVRAARSPRFRAAYVGSIWINLVLGFVLGYFNIRHRRWGLLACNGVVGVADVVLLLVYFRQLKPFWEEQWRLAQARSLTPP